MLPDSATPEHWRDAFVILLAHGSENTPGGAAFVRRQADIIDQMNLFAGVRAAFLRDTPHPRIVVEQADFKDIYVVPYMVSDGHSIDVLIPDALDLTGRLTELIYGGARKRVHLCRPIGTHRAVRHWSVDIINAIMTGHGLSPGDTAALVLSHGTKRHNGGRQYAEQVIRDISNSQRVCESAMLFLEDEPTINEWRDQVASRYIIALPYLMTAGSHGMRDIPEGVGIPAGDATFQEGVMAGQVQGPFDLGGRKLWYGPLLGTFSGIPDIVIDRIADWDKSVGQ